MQTQMEPQLLSNRSSLLQHDGAPRVVHLQLDDSVPPYEAVLRCLAQMTDSEADSDSVHSTTWWPSCKGHKSCSRAPGWPMLRGMGLHSCCYPGRSCFCHACLGLLHQVAWSGLQGLEGPTL